jgi:hypothetical protein
MVPDILEEDCKLGSRMAKARMSIDRNGIAMCLKQKVKEAVPGTETVSPPAPRD